jgi:hypothetical protein
VGLCRYGNSDPLSAYKDGIVKCVIKVRKRGRPDALPSYVSSLRVGWAAFRGKRELQ